jgi:uncharacterized membrane protein YkvA (DUF1232 family)
MRRILRVWRMSRNDLRLLWLALRHPNRPRWLLAATLALGIFALEPFNVAIPVLGVMDDLFLLPLLLHGLAKIAVLTTLPSTRDSGKGPRRVHSWNGPMVASRPRPPDATVRLEGTKLRA